MRPSHHTSMLDQVNEPVPGLLVGGPNNERRDNCRYPNTDPETSYVDSDNAYASNEVAIDWNAAMVYLVNALEAMQYGLGYSVQNNTDNSTTRK